MTVTLTPELPALYIIYFTETESSTGSNEVLLCNKMLKQCSDNESCHGNVSSLWKQQLDLQYPF